MSTNIVRAPWPQAIIDNINGRQARDDVHEYTCGSDGCSGILVAYEHGFECPVCRSYVQDWVLSTTLDLDLKMV